MTCFSFVKIYTALICFAVLHEINGQVPSKPNLHELSEITAKGFKVSWDPISGPLTRVDVRVRKMSEHFFIPKDCNAHDEQWIIALNPNETSYVFRYGKAYTSYEVDVEAKNGDITNLSYMKTGVTLEGPSEEPRNAKISPLVANIILINWELPCVSNGLLTHHEVAIYGHQDNMEPHEETQLIPIESLPNDLPTAYFMLKPDYFYTIFISENSELYKGLPLNVTYIAP